MEDAAVTLCARAGTDWRQWLPAGATDAAVMRAAARVNCLMAVYDGHGGKATAHFLAQTLHGAVLARLVALDLIEWEDDARRRQAISDGFSDVEREWFAMCCRVQRERDGGGGGVGRCVVGPNDSGSAASNGTGPKTSGSTALMLVVTTDHVAYVANVGDCRAILVRSNRVVSLSRDHTPALASERRRVILSGGRVQHSLVQGVLQMTRAFGNYELKHEATLLSGPVTALPVIKRTVLTDGDAFFLLASDGVWDVLSSKAAASVVVRTLRNTRDRLDKAAKELAHVALRRGSTDNVTVLLCQFDTERAGKSEEAVTPNGSGDVLGSPR